MSGLVEASTYLAPFFVDNKFAFSCLLKLFQSLLLDGSDSELLKPIGDIKNQNRC